MKAVLKAAEISSFDAVIPNEIGGMNSFEALLAGQRFGKSTLDTDCVARAYPFLWQTVRCLEGIPLVPIAAADGRSDPKVRHSLSLLSQEPRLISEHQVVTAAEDVYQTEELMRDACTELGSLAGICVNPLKGVEARSLPRNSFSLGKSHLSCRMVISQYS